MSINDEFELVPRGALKDLKKEIELLKLGQQKGSADDDLNKNIALLRKSVDAMYELFKKASEEIKLEDRDQNLIERKLEPLTSKVEALTEQNQKIAKALVTISNMVQENMKKMEDAQKKAEETVMHMPDLPKMSSQPILPPSMGNDSVSLSQPGLSAEPLPRPGMPSMGMSSMGMPPMGGSQASGGLSMPPLPKRKDFSKGVI